MISRILFESPWLLVITWVAVQFILIAVWSWQRSKAAGRIVWVGFAAAPLLLITSVLVVTPREQIINLTRTLAGHVDDPNLRAIKLLLADDFHAGDFDRDTFLDRLEPALTKYRIDDPRLRWFQVSFPESDVGVVEFHATAHVRSPEVLYDWIASRWRLTFRREGEQWLLTEVESLPTPPLNLDNLRDWLP